MNFCKAIGSKLTAGLLAAVTMASPVLAIPGTVTAEGGLRMRDGVGSDAAVITVLPNGTQVDVTAVTDEGWFQISYMDTMGYVSGDYMVLNQDEVQTLEVVTEPVYVKIVEGPLNVRSLPGTEGERVKQLRTGAVVEVVSVLDGWYEIEDGYICADYANEVDAAEAEAYNSASSVVDYAMQFKGCPYVYGGTSPRGFDCSGFVQYVFAHFGVSLNRTASNQMDNGTPVSMSELLPGDAVFFKKAGSSAKRASHVGIYIGNGQFIHASTSTTGVIISDMDYAYYTTGFVGGRRMI